MYVLYTHLCVNLLCDSTKIKANNNAPEIHDLKKRQKGKKLVFLVIGGT